MSSAYLDLTRRTEAQAVEDLTRQRDLRVFREMARDYGHYATGAENSENYERAERLRERQGACQRAALRLDPMFEGPWQVLNSIRKGAW